VAGASRLGARPDAKMSKTVLVLAVPHQLQGPKFLGFVADPSYNLLVKSAVLRRGVNFIFEEASGLGPSVAEEIARTLLGPGHYMDIDPSREEREKYGIAKETGEGNPNRPLQFLGRVLLPIPQRTDEARRTVAAKDTTARLRDRARDNRARSQSQLRVSAGIRRNRRRAF